MTVQNAKNGSEELTLLGMTLCGLSAVVTALVIVTCHPKLFVYLMVGVGIFVPSDVGMAEHAHFQNLERSEYFTVSKRNHISLKPEFVKVP
jgi:hypothetical protein